MDGTYLLAAGGTGGHLFPAIAVARALVERHPAARALFVGSDRELECGILARESFEHRPLPAASTAVLRRNPAGFAWRNWQAYRAALQICQETRPAAVIGCGGFASVAPVLAASRLGIPVILLEQNASPGRATTWLARRADVVCLSFAESAAALPRGVRSVVTGNPVRREIARLAEEPRSRPASGRMLLILGGSQGAQHLNAAIRRALRPLRDDLSRWRIIHQTGHGNDLTVREEFQSLALNASAEPFLSDMAAAYRKADLVVSRAGATTLAELACARLPALLVPYPHAARDHQQHNADVFVRAGGALAIGEQSSPDDTGSLLAQALRPLLRDDARREQMAAAMQRLARPDATSAVLAQLTALGCLAAA